MANWQYKLDIKEVWQSAKRGEITPHQLAQKIAAKMRELNCWNDDELEEIATLFEDTHPSATFDDTDIIMERLYDWGDSPHSRLHYRMCWIATF